MYEHDYGRFVMGSHGQRVRGCTEHKHECTEASLRQFGHIFVENPANSCVMCSSSVRMWIAMGGRYHRRLTRCRQQKTECTGARLHKFGHISLNNPTNSHVVCGGSATMWMDMGH